MIHRLLVGGLGLLSVACGGDKMPNVGPDASVPLGIDAPVAPAKHRVFVTSGQFGANLGGLAGADAACQGAATAAALGGTWRAWLSTSSVDAIDHIADVSPWYLIDGTTLAFSSHAQLGGQPSAPIDQNESGHTYDPAVTNTSDLVVRTGSVAGRAAETCSDWTTTSANSDGTYGFLDDPSTWTAFASGQCNTTNGRLYCFQQ